LHPERHIDGHVDVVLGPTVSCGGCHGAPPTTDKHPKVAENSCSQCHVETVDAQMLLLPAGKHMNGKVEVALAANANCASCHGAPPVSDKHPKLWVENCEKCHAATLGANMALLSGGTHMNGKVDFAIAPQTCDACHAAPPTEVGPEKKPHPKMTRCGKCHASSIDDAGKILAGGTHTNGKLEMVLPTACDACHGAPGSLGAPPPDHEGKTDPSLPSVGAHAAHILGKNYSKGGVTCTSCHVLPTSVDAPGHMYGLSTIFLDAASTWLGKATFDQPSQTCSGVSCHGAAIGGGTVPVPKWTQATIACDGCHGLPPPPSSGHVATDPTKGTQACALCHKKTVKADGSLDIQGGYHINGLVDP
jgi:predicted CxxxxCH...CXXCH cytochrome family protein